MATAQALIKSHRDLIAWQKAMDLVVLIYQATASFPNHELYGLTSQMRRASVSIPANIAEGQGRRSKSEFSQFLGNARGSLLELDTHLELALRLNYLTASQHERINRQVTEIGRIINGLMRSLTSDL
ncbi:MAG TPA: four helix bundle protein [Pyrinomonadaceae bacterium]|jgi:four helix bundle protein|nr:four helix bundle protein [Pyrinomonadaceae bacterium]